MALLQHDLGSGITKGSSHRLQHAVRAVQMLGDAKVGEHKSRVVGFCQVQEVLGF